MSRRNDRVQSVTEAIRILRAEDSDDSCDDDNDFTPQVAVDVSSESSDSSESNCENTSVRAALANAGDDQASSDDDQSSIIQSQWDTLPSRENITWKRLSNSSARGKAAAENVFSERPGPTPYSHRSVRVGSPLSAFRLFIDETMLRSIQKFTIKHGKTDNDNFSMDIEELEKFIGLQIARGVLVDKNTPIYQLWSKECSRIQAYKFCLISDPWNSFIENCKKCYVQILISLSTNSYSRAKLDVHLFSICQTNPIYLG